MILPGMMPTVLFHRNAIAADRTDCSRCLRVEMTHLPEISSQKRTWNNCTWKNKIFCQMRNLHSASPRTNHSQVSLPFIVITK